MEPKYISGISVKTIKMREPAAGSDNQSKRQPETISELHAVLAAHEEYLRRLAYKNTAIKTDETFFDDSDMRSEYYLVIVYDKNSDTPLLSARYYFDKFVIEKYLKGDNDPENGENISGEKLNLNKYKTGEIFLADRLSGNINCSVYRQNRNYIFSLFYSEILKNNTNCSLILMARKEKNDKLLKKYLNLGFIISGSTMHKGKEHWIVLADDKTIKLC